MMIQLLETIKIENGTALFLDFHTERLNQTRKLLFQCHDTIGLKNYIHPPDSVETYRCRLIYSKTIETIEYHLYKNNRHFNTLKIIENNEIDYPFKFLNRESLNQLTQLKGAADDILIIKQGWVTDTSLANICFLYQNQWVTPSKPLLKGTTRERLLREQQIVEAEIRLPDLKHFSKIALMNALIGFYVIENVRLI